MACRQFHGATGSASAHSPRRSACANTSGSEYLPEDAHASVKRALKEAWSVSDADLARKQLSRLASSLQAKHPGAAASLREGVVLCRCFLRQQDLVRANGLSITHDAISRYLGLRREGITDPAGELGLAGVISQSRGRIRALDCKCLKQRCCECYSATLTEKLLRTVQVRRGVRLSGLAIAIYVVAHPLSGVHSWKATAASSPTFSP